jgi:hypothetical protein
MLVNTVVVANTISIANVTWWSASCWLAVTAAGVQL